jgi:hypothetical protein
MVELWSTVLQFDHLQARKFWLGDELWLHLCDLGALSGRGLGGSFVEPFVIVAFCHLVENPDVADGVFLDGKDMDAGDLVGDEFLDFEAEFLAVVAIDFTHESAVLDSNQAIVHALLDDLVSELVLFDIVEQKNGDFRQTNAYLSRLKDGTIAILLSQGEDLSSDTVAG